MDHRKFLVVGDLHIKASNLAEGKELTKQIVQQAIRLKAEQDVHDVVLMGDLLDNHANVHSQAYNVVVSLLEDLQGNELNVWLLVGNHDYINNSQFCTEEHPYNAFKSWSRIAVVDRPCQLEDGPVFCPYVPAGRFEEALETYAPLWRKAPVIFAHQEFEGSTMGGGGDVWSKKNPLVVSGHIHDRHWHQENIFYVGSPIQHRFSESVDKCIYVMEFPSEGNHIIQEIRLDLPGKMTFETTVEDVGLLALPAHTHVRLQITCTPSEWTAFRKTKRYKELLDMKVKVIPVAPDDHEQMTTMARKRTTYIDALKTHVSSANAKVQAAFEEILRGVSL